MVKVVLQYLLDQLDNGILFVIDACIHQKGAVLDAKQLGVDHLLKTQEQLFARVLRNAENSHQQRQLLKGDGQTGQQSWQVGLVEFSEHISIRIHSEVTGRFSGRTISISEPADGVAVLRTKQL